MRKIVMPALFFLTALPCLAFGATYQWRDDAGVLHFTDDSDRIPERYLKRATESDATSAGKGPAAAGQKTDAPSAAAPEGAAAVAGTTPPPDRKAALAAQLNKVRAELAVEKKELARLRHRWMVKKGRTPTLEEAKSFQKLLAEGKTTERNNPYLAKSPLSAPGSARAAYYKKLEEVQKDEALERRLEQELEGGP